MFLRRTLDLKVMFLVIPIMSFHLRAIWVLLLWFGADVYLTLVGHGALPEETGVNFVAHGAGFAVGLFVGMAAQIYGAMRRFERLEAGHAWFGYWPASLVLPRHRRRR